MFADDDGSKLEAAPIRLAVDDDRFARLDDPACQALAVLERRELVAVLVGKVDDARLPVQQRDIGDVGLENRAYLLAHQFEQVGKVELARELLRHCVDRCQLRRPLLRLGEQACVLDRDGRLE